MLQCFESYLQLQTRSQWPSQSSSLLILFTSLPLELQLIIFQYALCVPYGISPIVERQELDQKKADDPYFYNPFLNILLVNREFYALGKPIAYGQNKFKFFELTALCDFVVPEEGWLRGAATKTRSLIKHVEISLNCSEVYNHWDEMYALLFPPDVKPQGWYWKMARRSIDTIFASLPACQVITLRGKLRPMPAGTHLMALSGTLKLIHKQ